MNPIARAAQAVREFADRLHPERIARDLGETMARDPRWTDARRLEWQDRVRALRNLNPEIPLSEAMLIVAAEMDDEPC